MIEFGHRQLWPASATMVKIQTTPFAVISVVLLFFSFLSGCVQFLFPCIAFF